MLGKRETRRDEARQASHGLGRDGRSVNEAKVNLSSTVLDSQTFLTSTPPGLVPRWVRVGRAGGRSDPVDKGGVCHVVIWELPVCCRLRRRRRDSSDDSDE
jgi:hypothetical protein